MQTQIREDTKNRPSNHRVIGRGFQMEGEEQIIFGDNHMMITIDDDDMNI